MKFPKLPATPRVYIETTIVSYLTAWPSRDIQRLAHQSITADWWRTDRHDYELFISQVVTDESAKGDKEAADARLNALAGIPSLPIDGPTFALAEQLIKVLQFPKKAELDGYHIALSATHGMDFLLTWNCTHIANARMNKTMRQVCLAAGYEPPVICTPEELRRMPS